MTGRGENVVFTTVELCTLCTQYLFAYTIQLEQVLEKRIIYNTENVFKHSKKLDTFFVSYFFNTKK